MVRGLHLLEFRQLVQPLALDIDKEPLGHATAERLDGRRVGLELGDDRLGGAAALARLRKEGGRAGTGGFRQCLRACMRVVVPGGDSSAPPPAAAPPGSKTAMSRGPRSRRALRSRPRRTRLRLRSPRSPSGPGPVWPQAPTKPLPPHLPEATSPLAPIPREPQAPVPLINERAAAPLGSKTRASRGPRSRRASRCRA